MTTITAGSQHYIASIRATKQAGILSLFVRLEGVSGEAPHPLDFNYFVKAEIVETADIRVGDRLVFDEPAELVPSSTNADFQHIRGGRMSRQPRQTEVAW